MTAKKTDSVLFRAEATTADLLRAVTRVAAVTERRNTIPILGCVELAMGFGTIAVRGTDLDIEVRTEIEGTGESAVCLPACRLRDLLRAVSHVERVSFEADENGAVTMTAGEVTATMNSLPAIDFPNMTMGNKAWGASLAEGVLQFLIGGVSHAISREETRYYLNGICLEVKDGILIAVATDGHRLAKRETGLPAKTADQGNVIFPRKAAALAVQYAGKGEATITAHKGVAGDRVGFVEVIADGVRLRAKTIDGTFPDWRRVVPVASNTVIAIETKVLRRALKLSASSGYGMVRPTKFAFEADGVRVSSKDPDFGEARAKLGCEVSAKFDEFGLNGRYLDELAASMERIGSKTMRMHFTSPGAPLRIVPDEAIAGTLNVLMPMRV
ncbi:DNA polymerase III subunit beta [Methylobacterium soli]|uniref:Beta sliding clamp n=1 Tax=Methylobacterium soli TaxID=553447 RepID=A0A6L3ST08_9HYPH|nr:DNA polymerase III subunit beta [Methylobacterium soli]KAB1076687.1 DNA polymerase III subunit beta [Methylobacterium soli]GJE43492.1 Beta sliding clamp [Methylobacterium soli]